MKVFVPSKNHIKGLSKLIEDKKTLIVSASTKDREVDPKYFDVLLENNLSKLLLDDDFESNVKTLNKLLRDENIHKELSLFVAGLEDDGTLNVAQYGDVHVLIFRKNKLTLIVGPTKKDSPQLNFISSGDIKDGDLVIVTYGLEYTTEVKGYLEKALSHEDLDELYDVLQKSSKLKIYGLYDLNLFVFEGVDEDNIMSDESVLDLDFDEERYAVPKKQSFDYLKYKDQALVYFNKYSSIAKKYVSGFTKSSKFSIPDSYKKIDFGSVTSKLKLPFGTSKIRFNKNSKLILIALVPVIIFIFIGSLYLGYQARQNGFEKERYQELLTDAQKLLIQSKQFVVTQNKIQAKQYLERVYATANTIKDAGFFVADATRLIDEVKTEQEKLDNITYIKNPLSIYESTDNTAKSLVVVEKDLYMVSANKVYGPLFSQSSGSTSEYTMPSNEIIVDAAPFLASNSIIVLTNANKLYELKNSLLTELKFKAPVTVSFDKVITYGSRSKIYLLSSTQNDVFGTTKIGSTLSALESYNTSNQDLKSAVSLAIDGNIYMLLKNGSVSRSYAKENIPLEMVSGPTIPMNSLSKDSKIYTNENLRKVYIFDSEKNRILVYRKDPFTNIKRLVYERVFAGQGITIKDFWVDNDESSIYIIDSSKVYKVSMNTEDVLVPKEVKIIDEASTSQ